MAVILPIIFLSLLIPALSLTFKPTAGTTWNIQLLSPPPPSSANNPNYLVWDMDVFDTPNTTIQTFHSKNHPVICYFSAGSYESWRPDAKKFPQAALGKKMSGWDERWLDTNNAQVRQIMSDRIALARAKGCDGVDPDNIDGYDNDTGFDLDEEDAADYVSFLSATAHGNGLSYGLKNGGSIVNSTVVSWCEWVVVEQCVRDGECALYRPFVQVGKPVFQIEYNESEPAPQDFLNKSCGDPDAKGFSTLIKHLNLSSWTETCGGYISS